MSYNGISRITARGPNQQYIEFDPTKFVMKDGTAYVNVAYFHKLMCDFGRQDSFNIGTRNTGLTSVEINAAAQTYGLSAAQIAALHKVND